MIATANHWYEYRKSRDGETFTCNCVGPQDGEPLCPCQMRGVIKRDGRYVMPERDLGPAPDNQRSDDDDS